MSSILVYSLVIIGFLGFAIIFGFIIRITTGNKPNKYIPDTERMYLNSLNSNNNDDDDWWWNPMYSYLPNNVWNGVDDDE